MIAYHDREWGVPVRDDGELFERLMLECFQAGLSWETILNKRENFRKAFDGFDPRRVAAYGEQDRRRLLAAAGIVRHRGKIDAAIANAQAFLRVQEGFGGFGQYAWSFVGGKPLRRKHEGGTLPSRTPESDAFSKDLKKRGFTFVGSTTVYAFMQSVGMVDDHVPECWKSRRAR
jgi:DNA-3-methyladenine glycosylase I